MDSSVMEVPSSTPMAFIDGSYRCLVLDRLSLQRELKNFCDVVLHADDHEYPAHRNVLAASSPYLEASLTRNNQSTEHIVINCGNHRTFEAVLNYMYSGKITIDKESVTEVLRLANFLVIAKLKEHCAEYLQQGLSTSSCFHIRDLADSNGLSVLSKTVEAFIFAHVIEIISHEEVLELSESKLDFLISRSMPLTEIQRVKLICLWVEHRVDERKTRFPALLTHILWERVGAIDLCHFLQDTALLTDCEFCMYHVLQSLKDSCLLPDIYFDSLSQLRSKFVAPLNSDSSATALMVVAPNDDDDVVTGDQEELAKDWDSASLESETTIILDQSDTCLPDKPSPATETPLLPSGVKKEKQDTVTPASPDGSKIPPRSKSKRVSKKLVQIQDQEPPTENDQKDCSKPEILRKTRKRLRENDENAAGVDTDTVSSKEKKPKKSSSVKISKSSNKTPLNKEVSPVKTKRKRRRNCPRLICDHCPFTTLNREKMEVHTKSAHHDSSKFSCTMCSFTCNWNREFYQHMKTHYPGPPHLCNRCGFSADRVQVLLVHQMDHTDDRPYECKTCGMKFKMKNNLVAHSRCHSGEKPFVCPDCDRSFATKGTLEQHAVTHSNQRPYLCDLCGFSTKYQSHLIAHKRLHTGDVFKCQFMNCDYSTPKRSQLACHMRCHMRIRSHTCATCGKSFVEKSHLVRHERLHLDDKPFKCDLCDYSSTRRDKLKEHQAKYHDDSSTARMAYHPRKPKQPDSTQPTGTKSAKPAKPDKAKPDKAVKPGKLPKPAKTTKRIIATVKRASNGQSSGGSSTSDVVGSGTAQQNCDAHLGVLIDTGVASDQQNICMYAQSGLLPLQLNTYAALGLVPLQTNGGLAAIQINAITPVQANLVPHDLLNIGSNGQVNVLSGGQVVGQGGATLHNGSNGHASGITNGQIAGLGNMNTFLNGQIIGLGNVLCGGQVDLVSNGHSNAAALTNQVNGQPNTNSPNDRINGPLNGQVDIYSNGQLIAHGSIPSDQVNGHLNAIANGQVSVIGLSGVVPGSQSNGQMDGVSPTYTSSGQLPVMSQGCGTLSGMANADAIAVSSGNGISSGVVQGNGLSNGTSDGNGGLNSPGHGGSNGNMVTLWNGLGNGNGNVISNGNGNVISNGNGNVISNGNAIPNGNGSVNAHANAFSNANGNGIVFVPLNGGAAPVRLNGAANGGHTASVADPVDAAVDSGNADASRNARLTDS